jgi:glycosyltransferase involved in cell wall biosynthesis
MFLDFDPPLSNNDFFSIVIMSFSPPGAEGRQKYIIDLLQSIHTHADMPVEIIVHDDGSTVEARQNLFKYQDAISTLIFNTGVNMGFSASANRVVSMANSDYILFLNDDTLFTRPFLKDLKEVLDIPYIGAATPPRAMLKEEAEGCWVQRGRHRLHLGSNPKAPGHFAFHKDRWLETKGFPQVYSNGGDISFFYSLLRLGYFNAVFHQEGFENSVRNMDQEHNFIQTSGARVEYDQSYPRIFGVPDRWLRQQSIIRKNRRYPDSHDQYLQEFGIHNISSWRKYFEDARHGNHFDWNKLTKWGQDRWKSEVDADLSAFGEANK